MEHACRLLLFNWKPPGTKLQRMTSAVVNTCWSFWSSYSTRLSTFESSVRIVRSLRVTKSPPRVADSDELVQAWFKQEAMARRAEDEARAARQVRSELPTRGTKLPPVPTTVRHVAEADKAPRLLSRAEELRQADTHELRRINRQHIDIASNVVTKLPPVPKESRIKVQSASNPRHSSTVDEFPGASKDC